MQVMILDTFIEQTGIHEHLPAYLLSLVFKEYENLSRCAREGYNSLRNYLNSQNGIRMQGVPSGDIFKYRLTSGDRILYTFGRYLPWLKESERDSLVLIKLSKHDDQGTDARNFDLAHQHGYQYVEQILGEMHENGINPDGEFTEDDIVAFAELIYENYSNYHHIFVTSNDADYANLKLEDMDFRLSNEQDEVLTAFSNAPQPTMIIGGAGTGKTVIAVHALRNFSYQYIDSEKHVGTYFTQSPELRKKVEDIYNKISGVNTHNTVEFNDINDFCINRIGISRKNLFSTSDFLKYVEDNKDISQICHNENISIVDAWSEIRGVIKGAMDENWVHTNLLSQDDPRLIGSITNLVGKYFTRSTVDKRLFRLTDKPEVIKNKAYADGTLSPTDRENIKFACRYFSGFDAEKRTLSYDEYTSISEERTILPKSKRKCVFDICAIYEKHLQEEGLYDDNDLVRQMFSGNLVQPIYDFIAVDEVQDYTELQLYLITCLSKNNHIMLAGDEHQNINPASFSESRINSLFYDRSGKKLLVKRLSQNFRCQQEIIDLTNNLAKLRRDIIGNESAENEQDEAAMRHGQKPVRLKYSEDSMNALINEVKKYPRAVILVPDDKTKAEITEKFNLSNAENEVSKVYTVAEIKGMEYQHVTIFNIVGGNSKIWYAMISGQESRRLSKNRYYFNLLYVAATRAQDFLCFIDYDDNLELYSKLNVSLIELFDAKKLYFGELTADIEDFLHEAKEFEENGRYEDAIKTYKKIQVEFSDTGSYEEEIYRCKYAQAFINDKEFEKALMYAMILRDKKRVHECVRECSNDSKLLGEMYIKLSEDEPHNLKLGPFNVVGKIESCFGSFASKNEIGKIKRIFLELMKEAAFSISLMIENTMED